MFERSCLDEREMVLMTHISVQAGQQVSVIVKLAAQS